MALSDRDKVQEAIEKTEQLFEQKITYISAGTLVISVTFIDTIIPLVDAKSTICLKTGWLILVMTLLLNLTSQMISKYYLKKTLTELDKANTSEHFNGTHPKIDQRNKIIDGINWITLILMIIGISFIVIFTSINSTKKTSKTHKIEQQNFTDQKKHELTINDYKKNRIYYYGK